LTIGESSSPSSFPYLSSFAFFTIHFLNLAASTFASFALPKFYSGLSATNIIVVGFKIFFF
jgi:hypothetical protein